jgi:hypothetical protein
VTGPIGSGSVVAALLKSRQQWTTCTACHSPAPVAAAASYPLPSRYGVDRAKASNYAVNTLSGLKIYNADFQVAQAARDQSHKHEARRAQDQREERDQAAYAAYREHEAEEFLAAASAAVRLDIEAEAAGQTHR